MKVKDIIKDEKFNEFLGYEIEAYNRRPLPKEGFKYRRTPFDTLKDGGNFTVEYIREEFVRIANLESTLSAALREAITSLVFKVAQTVVNYRARKEKEAQVEYECTNDNPYGMHEYREDCNQDCDNCDYHKPKKVRI